MHGSQVPVEEATATELAAKPDLLEPTQDQGYADQPGHQVKGTRTVETEPGRVEPPPDLSDNTFEIKVNHEASPVVTERAAVTGRTAWMAERNMTTAVGPCAV
jgi:hypothetical protein